MGKLRRATTVARPRVWRNALAQIERGQRARERQVAESDAVLPKARIEGPEGFVDDLKNLAMQARFLRRKTTVDARASGLRSRPVRPI